MPKRPAKLNMIGRKRQTTMSGIVELILIQFDKTELGVNKAI